MYMHAHTHTHIHKTQTKTLTSSLTHAAMSLTEVVSVKASAENLEVSSGCSDELVKEVDLCLKEVDMGLAVAFMRMHILLLCTYGVLFIGHEMLTGRSYCLTSITMHGYPCCTCN